MKNKIVIIARGGVIVEVRSSTKKIDVEILDFDNHEDIAKEYKIEDTNESMEKLLNDVIYEKYPHSIF